MIIKDNKIHFYGKEVGEIKNKIAYVQKEFQCGELATELFVRGHHVVWVTE